MGSVENPWDRLYNVVESIADSTGVPTMHIGTFWDSGGTTEIEPRTQGFSVLIKYPCKWLISNTKPQKSSSLIETFRKTTGLFYWSFTLAYLLYYVAEKGFFQSSSQRQ